MTPSTIPKKRRGYWIPSAQDVIMIHADLTKLFGNEDDPISPPGVKDKGLLESACSRPHTSLGDREKYPSLVLKLAALTQSITKNHSFHNGNKRAALVTLLTALHRNDLCLKSTVTDDDVYDFIVAVTANNFPKPSHGLASDETIQKIAWWIRNNTEALRYTTGNIRVSDFVDRCKKAGMLVKEAGSAHVVMNPKVAKSGKQKSIRISRSTRQLTGPAAAAYVRKLGLNAQNSGIDSNEFYDGASHERTSIHRFIVALRKLART